MALAAGAWGVALLCGFGVLTAYAERPGGSTLPPATWPAGSRLPRADGELSVVMIIHPRCACTRASLAELAHVVDRAGDRVTFHVVAIGPSDGDEALLERAAAIPGVFTWLDEGGSEASLFGSSTSGHVLAFGRDGALLFSGGITGARGHEGANSGRRRLLDVLAGAASGRPEEGRGAPVFGCGLFDPPSTAAAGGVP